MDYKFKRDLKNSFMIVESGFENAGYEKNILRYNDIDVLVPFHTVEINNVTQVWYDITGLVSLKDYLMQQTITYELMRKVFLYLKIAIDETERFLIDVNHLSIDIDTIFVVKNDMEWKLMLIYCPDNNQSSLDNILEFFMDNVSKEMMDFCFKLYDSGIEGNTIEGIINLIDKEINCEYSTNKNDTDNNYSEELEEYNTNNEEEETNKKSDFKRRLLSDDDDYIWGHNSIDIFEENEKETLFEKIKRIITNYFNFNKKQDTTYEDFTYEPDQQIYEPTVLLKSFDHEESIIEGGMKGELQYLGEKKKDNIRINKDEFRLGSSLDGNDSVIDSPVVSRFHAKILREGKSYYLEDLNSTNGTCVNGKMLGYRDKVELNPEDTIMFADECYKIV